MSLEALPVQMPMDANGEAAVCEHVRERYEAAREFDRPFKESCLKDWKYVNNRLPEDWPYFWGLFAPETRIACNDTIENIMSTVFPKDNFFDLRACSGQSELQTEIMRECQKFALRRGRYKERYFFWEQDAIVYGNGVLATFAEPEWRKITVEQPILDPYGYGVPMGMQRVQQTKMQVWPQMKNVSRWNVFPFPGPVEGGDIQKMPYFVIRRFMPLEAVKAMAKKPWAMWRNTERLQGTYTYNGTTGTVSNASETQFEDLWNLLSYAGFNVTTQQSEGAACVRFCEVLYYYEAPPGERGCRAYAVMCENQLLACRGNEYEHAMKPLADIKWQPFHSDLWNCYGVAKEIRAYQDMINVRMAQRFEQVELFLRPPRVVGQAAGNFPLTSLNPWPNGHTRINGDPNAIRTLELPNVRPDMMQDDSDAKIGIQRSTRISNVSKGIADPALGEGATKTASGIKFLADSTQRAAALKTLFHEEIGIAPQLMQVGQILQQVLEDGTVINIGDVNETLKRAGYKGDRLPVRSADIAGEWEFYAVGSSKAQDLNVLAANMTSFWQPVLSDPEHGKKFDRMEIYKDAHEALFQRPITKYLKTEQDMAETMAQEKPGVPPPMLPKFKDLDTQARDVVKERLGLPVTGTTAEKEMEMTKAMTGMVKDGAKTEQTQETGGTEVAKRDSRQ